MGLLALYPKPNLSKPNPDCAEKHPYLLRNLEITRVNQVWSSDITYIPMRQGWFYVTAVIDLYSRYVLSWRLSNSLEGSFCLDALDRALELGCPEIFNTDQGVQYTSSAFVNRLRSLSIRVSWDGAGRALDNIFIERLWRSLKYEDIYLKNYAEGLALHAGLSAWFRWYNEKRVHQSLGYQTPSSVFHLATEKQETLS